MLVNASDPRVLRSLNTLLDAACELIEAKGLSTLSVTDVATKAGVTRPTFYHHFKDIRDLAQRAAMARIQLILPHAPPLLDDQTRQLSPAAYQAHVADRAEPILRHLQAHHRFYLTVFDQAGDLAFFGAMADFIAKRLFELSSDEPTPDPAFIEVRDTARFMSHGILWTVVTWLDSDFAGSNSVSGMSSRLASIIVSSSATR